jgi:hypothetical protein
LTTPEALAQVVRVRVVAGIVKWRWELHNQAQVQVLSVLGTSFFDVGAGESPAARPPD